MRLGTYRFGSEERPIALIGDGRAVDLSVIWKDLSATAAPTSVRDLLARDVDEQRALRGCLGELGKLNGSGEQSFAVDESCLGPAIPDPAKILCVGLNYDQHVDESHRVRPSKPEIFIRVARSLAGPFDPVAVPPESSQLDWEGELAIIIGPGGRRIAAEDAADHVAGYAVFNDMTLRDWQHRSLQWAPGKNFDGTGPLGPYLVTSDEVDPSDLEITTRVNGEVEQAGRTSQMLFKPAELIAFCSAFTTLEPGDVIATGTPGGVGFKRTPPRFLRAGDLVEVEIEQLGSVRSAIVSAA